MKIGIITYAVNADPNINYVELLSCLLNKNKEYCKRHNYDFLFCGEECFDQSRPPSVSKLIAIKNNLNNYDFLLWIDADAAIVNPELRLEELFEPHLDCGNDLIITRDAANNINAGVFLLRNCAWSYALIDKLWNMAEFLNHPWWENGALIKLYDSSNEDRTHIKIIDNNELRINCFTQLSDYKKGDFIIHFEGIRQPHLRYFIYFFIKNEFNVIEYLFIKNYTFISTANLLIKRWFQ
jgi:hypothetical protein